MIYNWQQLSFKSLCKWWVSGFCKLWNRSEMDFSYWWSICTNFTWTYFNFWQEYLCLICNGRERERAIERKRETERERERKRERERGNYLIKGKTSAGKSFEVFWDFVAFSLWNVFLNKTFYPRRKTHPAEKFAKQTLFPTICKKPLRMTFH